MKRALAVLSAASLLTLAGCSETSTSPEPSSVDAPASTRYNNPPPTTPRWEMTKVVAEMQKECTPKGIENGMTCMRPVGSTTNSNALAPGDTVWILYKIQVKAPSPNGFATLIDDVIKQCQDQLGPNFGCSAWGWDIAGLKAGYPLDFEADQVVYNVAFWLDIWNIRSCVKKTFVNTATLKPQTPSGATVVASSAPVTINVNPAANCVPPEKTGWEGCSPGFWKNKAAKSGLYNTNQKVNTVFSFAGTPYVSQGNQTFLQALGNGGGGIDALLRQAVAAYLNAQNTGVDYPLTSAQVVALVNGALNGSNNLEYVKGVLDKFNNLHGTSVCGDDDDDDDDDDKDHKWRQG